MNAHDLDAVLISETWFQSKYRDPRIPGFTLHRTDRRDGEGGETAIYVRNEFKHSASYVPDFRQLEATAVTVKTPRVPLRLTACYNTSAMLYIDHISGLTNVDEGHIVTGDFNVKHEKWHSRQRTPTISR